MIRSLSLHHAKYLGYQIVPQISGDDRLIRLNLSGCTLREYSPVLHHYHSVADRHNETHMVFNQNDRYPSISDSPYQHPKLRTLSLIHPSSWFIK
jgi:hypothetical protein